MKRVKGFTLAEVLITLGIIGVVAALTAPALIQNAGNAKIGPTLQKIKSTIENANERILYEEGASNLYSVVGANTADYMEALFEHISGSSYNDTASSYTIARYDTGASSYAGANWYRFKFSNNIDLLLVSIPDISINDYMPQGSYQMILFQMLVDINGTKTSPNTLGKDVFSFYIDASGSVIPSGSGVSDMLHLDVAWDDSSCSTDGMCCSDSSVGSGETCAGSIFENNLKVIYQ